jgi:hypothetical protein
VFLEEDGQTFLHLVTSQDDPSAVITGLPSFKKFQSELLASEPLQKPDQVGMSLVAASGESHGQAPGQSPPSAFLPETACGVPARFAQYIKKG